MHSFQREEVFSTYFEVTLNGVLLRPVDLVQPTAEALLELVESAGLEDAKGIAYSVIDMAQVTTVLSQDCFSLTLDSQVAVTDIETVQTALAEQFISANGMHH